MHLAELFKSPAADMSAAAIEWLNGLGPAAAVSRQRVCIGPAAV